MNQSTAYGAGESVGALIAYIVIYGGVLALGVYFGNRLARKREDGSFVRWPVGVAIAIVLLLMIGQCSSPSQAQSASVPNDIDVQQQNIGLASSFSNGFPPADLDGYNNGIRAGVVAAFKSHGLDFPPKSLIISSENISVDGRKVLKTKISVPSRLFQYAFLGISRGNAMRVLCTSRTARPFDPISTECGRQLKQIFGQNS